MNNFENLQHCQQKSMFHSAVYSLLSILLLSRLQPETLNKLHRIEDCLAAQLHSSESHLQLEDR